MTAAKNYKDSVNLPQTNFDMRANATKREPELQQFWAENQIYEHLSRNNPGEVFVLHDGPPYANGSLHMGHALNKILKDIINKYQLLQGRCVRYVPGWDCHGLPIELKVLQQMSARERQKLTPLTLRQKAREFAVQTVEEQRNGFKRYGVWGDWYHPYLTLMPEYEAAQIGVFGQMVLQGYIYRGLKAVHWSPSSRTALAEAELEYPEGHTSRSIYAAFKMKSLKLPSGQGFSKAKSAKKSSPLDILEPYLPNLWVAIWTTTPWTIPGNLAVAVNPELIYTVVEESSRSPESSESQEEEASASETGKQSAKSPKSNNAKTPKSRYLLVAAEAVERLSAILSMPLTVKATVKGKDLEYCTYKHPLFDRESPIVIGGDYVSAESGTGLVHTAPGHGQEDFIVGQRYGLPVLSPVDAAGKFTQEAGPFAGMKVLDEGNAAVVEALENAGSLLKEEAYVHKYPYDWRTKKPTIFRATEQWFASVDGFREAAMGAISSVTWIPASGKNRIEAMVSERSDWCISRQRSWGVPIPVFYEEETGEPLLNAETIARVQTIIAQRGSDAWWELPVEELLPESYRHNGKTYRKGTDTMDVWFDSGTSWAAVVQQRPELSYPVDMYLEGSDQHRGWFQSSLLTSVATMGNAPYQRVLTHGFVLDEQGRKMSKSLGNVIDPATIIDGGKDRQQEPAYGADVLRLWVSSVDYSSDVAIGKNIIKQLGDVYRKIRNTARFLLGNIHDFDPTKDGIAYEELPELDRYMLHRVSEVFEEVTRAFESYQFFRFFQTVQNFCVVDLSNFYLDVAKDRLYISAPTALRRRSCQTVLAVVVENLAKAIAPVLCHMAEDIWQNLPYETSYQSVFAAGWVRLDPQWKKPELAVKWEKLRHLRAEVNQVMERARMEKAIGSSLEAKVLLYVADEQWKQQLGELNVGVSLDLAPLTEPSSIESTTEEKDELVSSEEILPQEESEEISSTVTSQQEWQQVLKGVAEFISRLPDEVSEFVGENRRSLVVLALILSAMVTFYVALAIAKAALEVPILSPVLEFMGIGYTAWFLYRYCWRAETREELLEMVRSLSEEVISSSNDISEPPQQIDDRVQGEETEVKQEKQKLEAPKISEEIPQLNQSNGVDELRYLFIASQVELLESPATLEGLQHCLQSENLAVCVVKADGEKCDRCWNYSTQVGRSVEHPAICERCVAALAGEF